MHTVRVGIHKDFCFNLQRIRKAKGFTQESLAAELGTTRNYIQQLEHGYKSGIKLRSKARKKVKRQWPSPETIAKLAKALDCEENDFFLPEI
ncbi:hypothetical protein Bb109J_c1936 [Bdellovibrio bacteriovorus]|uniref:helix-turn-helix domain-containing protein n=1 Tax=Bdellovibrio bacteriovorus TaxID=959 RepID=UPI00045C1336|nr:helix-turn-helix transcriptional regulator [Bdellovibrio bacteriovorus]AHZ84626.1 hypothetical protein EP01_06705 [Bdellovibrio bacteriovorus]BEV68516.1 hypothetical protein Bb109J_c1936 [Bdellovibrio bacteriovorus]